MTTFLAQLPVERLGWVLIHSLWQFLLIALVVRLFERAFAGRSGASTRYVAGLCGLSAMTATPVITWFFIAVTSSTNASPAPGSVVERSEELRSAPAAATVSTMADPVSTALEVRDQPRAEYSFADLWSTNWTTLAARLRPWLPLLVLGWIVGASFSSLRPFVGWLTLRRLRTVGVSAVGQGLEESARRIADRLGTSHMVSVLRSTLAKTPLVVGYLRPVLLIPVVMVAQLPLADLEAILAHELAHVRRHDFLVNLWQTLLETVFFYHPAVWSLSHRLSIERENCCDDIALSVVGDPVCYGRALLHVEELRGPEPLLALGASGGSLRSRILRLFGQSEPPNHGTGLMAGLLLPSLVLVGVFAAFVLGAPGDKEEKPQPKPDPAPATRSLDIVIAEHVILWDGRIRTWDEVVTELREIRKAKGKAIHPHFHVTNGAHSAGHFQTYQAKVFEIDKGLFESVSLGSMSPRAAPRYDVIRKAEDLVPDPKMLRSGVVVEKGKPRSGVLVVLVPEAEGGTPVVLKPDLTLRDPLDEVWTVTGPDGRFTLPVQPAHAGDKLADPPAYSLAAISPKGYGLEYIPAEGKDATIEFRPLAKVELTPVEGKPQRIDLTLHGGLPDKSPGFSIYEIDLRDKSVTVPVPAGKTTVYRAFPNKNGSISYPAETVLIGPDESSKVELPNITEEEAEKKFWSRPKDNVKESEGK